MATYIWQCLSGHNGEIPQGMLLEAKAMQREKDGYFDAICISFEQCPECQADKIERLGHEIRLCGDAGCPMGADDCKDGCLAELELREFESRCRSLRT